MDLTCYVHPGWRPLLRPAPARRDWMDGTPDAFAYRCLPLNIANAHGWELLNPCAFEACWDGRPDVDAVSIKTEPGASGNIATSLFGQGVVTFHVQGIMRTSPGWNLWVSGSPNQPKDGIAPLTGVVETDWSPFTFTMNWRFTRPRCRVRFAAGESFCFFFPVQRAVLDTIVPTVQPIDAEPDLRRRFDDWSRARDTFQETIASAPPAAPADKWQKHYYRGLDQSGATMIADHQTHLRLKPFADAGTDLPAPGVAGPSEAPPSAPPARPSSTRVNCQLQRREWLLETLERQRSLAPRSATIERRAGLSADEFLERYYAANRPVILTGEMADWPALAKWTPEYLKRKVGPKVVEFQGNRKDNQRFEIEKVSHRRTMPFDAFIDMILQPGAGNDAYLTAFNSARNAEAMALLHPDLGFLGKFLDRDVAQPNGMMWIGPAGTLTSLHHDLTNNFIAQIVGRKRILLLPAGEVGKLYNHLHVFSEIGDLEDPALPLDKYPRLSSARFAEVTLMPGDILFMPLAWWHQVRSVDFSVTITSTNFRWPNDGYRDFPPDETEPPRHGA